MSKLNAIRVALENHLATTPAFPSWFLAFGTWDASKTWLDAPPWLVLPPALPAIAWPNVPFTPVTGTPYIRADFVPTLRRPVVAGPDPEQRLSGLFMLTVFTPEAQGAAAGMEIADKLLDRFNGSGAIIASTVTVRLEYSEARMPLHSPPFYAIPVEIGWYAYSR
jgi:hypothetical protein